MSMTKHPRQENAGIDAPPIISWHAVEAGDAAQMLGVDRMRGLSTAEARVRLARYGPNSITGEITTPWHRVLGRQFVSALILILVAAALIAFAIGETVDALVILAIVVLNGLLGFAQEWKAEKAMAALRAMLVPRCTVFRDESVLEIDALQLVPGDVVILKTGDRVPADLRLVEAVNLRVDESLLTGESGAVNKRVEPVAESAVLAERFSMAWMGTSVTNGRAKGLVAATGMATEFGRIARLTQSVGEEITPLQRKLARLGKQLGTFALAISALVSMTGWLLGRPLFEMFLSGVSLAVAVVPEGLPAVVTITLALGVRAMVQRRALLRRLQASETLGAATMICTDKTGTLTQNQMTVQEIWLPGGALKVTGSGFDPKGEFVVGRERIIVKKRADLQMLLKTGLRCSHAQIVEDRGQWSPRGEPTEVALVVAAAKAGVTGINGQNAVAEFSFNSARKRMTVVAREGEELIAHVKGAPEVLLGRCTRVFDGQRERELSGTDRKAAHTASRHLAEQGLRTLAVARRQLDMPVKLDEDNVERDLTLLGIVGMRDPPRPEVPEALKLARSAGIGVIMITGDAPGTALAVARNIGMAGQHAVTGGDLAEMDDEELLRALASGAVFARTTPEHKIRIVTLLQRMGHVVAMTGDGVNDAPALKKAEVGIAMGLRGTDVAKGASDMILTDDNFASIINAVEEGRRQYENIQKFVRYLLSSNIAEVIAIFLNIFLGGPLILLPSQILWMNLVTDGMTAVALGLEPAERGVMRRPPRAPGEAIVDRLGIAIIIALGAYMGLATLGMFHFYLTGVEDEIAVSARTVAFTGIIVLEKINVFNFRALREPITTIGIFSNPWLLLAWFTSLGLQAVAVYVPFFQQALRTVPLSLSDWGMMMLVGAPLFLVPEAVKQWIAWHQDRRRS